MAKIPTVIATEGIRTGSTGPQASPGSFGAAYDVGGSALNLSRGMRSVTSDVLAVRDARKRHEETRWVNDSYNQEYKYLHDWSKAQIDAQSETMAEDFWKHANERIAEYTAKAPSKRAAEAYRGEMQRFVQGRYSSLAKTVEDIRIDKTIGSINDQIQNALGIYRESRAMPNSNSVIELNNEYERLSAYIDSSFGNMAPQQAAKMKEHLAVEMALGTMDYNPAFSKMIIETDKNIDERTRTTLTNQLEQSQRDGNRALADQFTRVRKDHLVMVEAGQTLTKIPESEYIRHYGKDAGIREKRDDDFWADTYIRSNQFMAKYGGWNADALMSAYKKLEGERKTAEDKAVLGILSERIRESVTLQYKDLGAWLSNNNPELIRLNREVVEATTPESKNQALSARNFAMLKYQGYPPEGVADPELYHNRATDDRVLMSVPSATAMATRISKGKASEVIGTVQQMMAEFPDHEHQYIAFKNLVTLPPAEKAINRMYQLVWEHRDKWWVDALAGAIDNVKDLGKLNPATTAEVNKRIDGDETWIKFRRTMVDDNMQGASEVAAYREGIAAFANYFMSNGLAEKEAVNKSINLLIKGSMGFTSVNGQALAITKQKPNGQYRDDDEIADYGRRLEVALEHLDPRYVNTQNFPMLKQFQTDEKKWNFFYQSLREKGFFRLSPDGQYVTIYYPDDLGIPFQLTDEKNNPFMIYLDELPVFHRPSPVTGPIGGTVPIKPEGKDIYEVEGNYLGLGHILGTRKTQTNWPGLPFWMRSAPRKQQDVYGDKYLPPATYKTP